jgi:hypothetical protein
VVYPVKPIYAINAKASVAISNSRKDKLQVT